jgi:hypothetical protein
MKTKLTKLGCGFALLGAAVSAQAQNSFNWSLFGEEGTMVTSGSSIPSVDGSVNVTAYDGTGQFGSGFQLYTEGSNWSGNFSPGENLLFDQGSTTGVTLGFSTGVSDLTIDLQNNIYGAFTYSIGVYDTGNNFLGTVTGSGTAADSNDGSEPQAEVNYSNIGSVVITTSDPYAGGFAIGTVTLTSVPEPSTLALAGLGGLGMLWQLRRRK